MNQLKQAENDDCSRGMPRSCRRRRTSWRARAPLCAFPEPQTWPGPSLPEACFQGVLICQMTAQNSSHPTHLIQLIWSHLIYWNTWEYVQDSIGSVWLISSHLSDQYSLGISNFKMLGIECGRCYSPYGYIWNYILISSHLSGEYSPGVFPAGGQGFSWFTLFFLQCLRLLHHLRVFLTGGRNHLLRFFLGVLSAVNCSFSWLCPSWWVQWITGIAHVKLNLAFQQTSCWTWLFKHPSPLNFSTWTWVWISAILFFSLSTSDASYYMNSVLIPLGTCLFHCMFSICLCSVLRSDSAVLLGRRPQAPPSLRSRRRTAPQGTH